MAGEVGGRGAAGGTWGAVEHLGSSAGSPVSDTSNSGLAVALYCSSPWHNSVLSKLMRLNTGNLHRP